MNLIRLRGLLRIFSILLLFSFAFAEGTRTWEQSKFEELIKGTTKGVAVRSTGGLELAPAFTALSTTPSTYIWSIAADREGNLYAASGSPARVYRITPDGKSTVIFEPQELQVQALVVDKSGVIYAATNPDGKVYKISDHPASSSKDKKSTDKPASDSLWSSSVYFEPGTKYIWDLVLDDAGNLYVATGDHGQIFRVTPKGEHSVFFQSDEAHIRVMAFDTKGNLIAGSDGSGLVYRISPAGEGFVLYSAPKKEITALALDHSGNIYAAAVGEKRAGPGGNAAGAAAMMAIGANAANATTPTPGLTVTPAPGATALTGTFAFPGGGANGGSDVYKIAPDGSPSRIWTSHEDIVYALAFDAHDRLL